MLPNIDHGLQILRKYGWPSQDVGNESEILGKTDYGELASGSATDI